MKTIGKPLMEKQLLGIKNNGKLIEHAVDLKNNLKIAYELSLFLAVYDGTLPYCCCRSLASSATDRYRSATALRP
jgi:hypothetical protein